MWIVAPLRELCVELVVVVEGHGLVHRVERLVEQPVLVVRLADLANGVAPLGVHMQDLFGEDLGDRAETRW